MFDVASREMWGVAQSHSNWRYLPFIILLFLTKILVTVLLLCIFSILKTDIFR